MTYSTTGPERKDLERHPRVRPRRNRRRELLTGDELLCHFREQGMGDINKQVRKASKKMAK